MDRFAQLVGERAGLTVLPKSVVTGIVIVCTLLLVADVSAQFVPGSTHEANQVLDAALLALIGGAVTASRGPKPEDAETPPEPAPADPSAAPGRHRGPS